MATDPTQMFGALLGTLEQTGNIQQNAQAYQGNQQALQSGQQQLALGALQLAAAKQQQAQQQQYQQDVQSYYQNPTLDRLSALAAKYPQQAAALKQSYDIMNEGQRQSALTQFGSLYNAADNNKPDLVRAQLEQIKSAEQKQGIDTTDIDNTLDALNSDPASAMNMVKGFAQIHLAAAGVDKFQLGDQQNHYSQFGSGGIFDQRTGEIIQQPADKPQYVWDSTNSRFVLKPGTGGGDQPSGGGGASGAPRSVRNNNPGNLKASPFTRKLPGFTGVDPDGFAVFDSPQSGANAQASLLKNYMSRGYNTVSKIISRWAPPSDRNDTAAYIKTVAGKLGVNPNDTLSPVMVPQLQSAISGVEGGPNNPSNGPISTTPQVVNVPISTASSADAYVPGTTVGGLSGQAIDLAAARYNLTGKLPPNLGRRGDVQRAILSRAAQLSGNSDAGSLLAGQAGREADTAALKKLEGTANNVLAFERTALHNGALALRLAGTVDNGNVPLFNRWKNAGSHAVGDPNIDAFNAAIDTFANEYAKVTTSATGGGVTSDAARDHARSLINSAQSPQQLLQTMNVLTADMENRKRGLSSQRQEILTRIQGGGNSSAPSGFRILRVRPAQ